MKTNQQQKNPPSDWQQVKLGDVSFLNKQNISDKYDFKDFYYIDLSSVNYGILQKNEQKINIKNAPSRARRLFQKDDVLFANVRPNLLGHLYVNFDTKDFVCSTGFTVVSPNKNLLSGYFIYNYFFTKKFTDYIENITVGSSYPAVNSSDLEKLRFHLPPLPEQNRIVSVLETWDRSIEKLSKKIEIKKQIKKGLMQDLLTGKRRLKGFIDKWRFVNLGDTCQEIKTGKLDANAMIENGKYRFYTCAKDFYFINDYAFDTEALLVSGNGANVGYVHYYKGKFNAYQRTYVLFGFNENILFIKYLLDVFLKFRIKEEVREGNTPYITMDTLTDMNLKVPTHKEQQSIVHILSAADEEIKKLEDKLKIFKDQKKYLLNSLITGTIRTPETLSTKLTK